MVAMETERVRVVVRSPEKAPATQQFFAIEGAEWKLTAESFAPDYTRAGAGAVRLWDTRKNAHRHLVTALEAKCKISNGDGGDEGIIELKSEYEGAIITETISLKSGETFAHIDVTAELPGSPAKLDFLLSAYTFARDGAPSFIHTPGVKFDDPRAGAGRDQITGDRSFHAPAVILQEAGFFTALVPDLAAINAYQVLSPDARRAMKIQRGAFSLPWDDTKLSMPTGIDLNVRSGLTNRPVMTFGLMDALIGHHIRYVRPEPEGVMVRTLSGNRVGYAFDLFVSANEPAGAGYQKIAQHQWKRFGHPIFSARPHLAMPFEEYAKLVTKTIFSPIRMADGKPVSTPAGVMDPPVKGYEDTGSWLEWDMDGTPVGGFRCAAPFWNDVIHNSPFWNSARDAVGMAYWGRELGDEKLAGRARRIVNFCLAAPRNEHGLFATLFNAGAKTWGRSWTEPTTGNNRLFLRDSRCYEIPALCKTGAHLLDYHLRAEPDARIVAYLRPFAEWLANSVDERGTVPSYVTDKMEASPILRDSAQSAVAMWFLAEMFNATKDNRFREAATQIAMFIERDVLPAARWIDFEQYLSCGAKSFGMVRDEWQAQWFRGNLCVIWAAEGFAALHRADQDSRWLKDGARCLDYLSFTQCVWQPHYIYTANPFGGFGVDNSDSAPMLDQRQAETVRPFLYFGKAMGRADFIERGVAAAHSGCVLIVHPRHAENGIFPHARFYPVGLSPENIDHEAHPQCPMRTHPSWGEGSSVFTGLAEARRELGGLYLDAGKQIAIGVDAVRVKSAEFSNGKVTLSLSNGLASPALKAPWDQPFRVPVFSVGLQQILLSGHDQDEKSSRGAVLQIEGNGAVRFAR